MAERAEIKLFTIDEANASIRKLEEAIPALRRVLREMEQVEDRLQILDLICNRSVSSANQDLHEYLALRVKYHDKITEFENGLLDLEKQGFLLRDLDEGIVHFVARKGNANVLLCWKEGEGRVSHWHDLESPTLPDEKRRRPIEDEKDF